MNKILFLVLIVANLFSSENIKPSFVYNASGGVTDLVSKNNKLYGVLNVII